MSPDEFGVADLSLAAFGRKEIQLGEHEMPGLMAVRVPWHGRYHPATSRKCPESAGGRSR
jgi:S-adenosylhomocysteine hydrolase